MPNWCMNTVTIKGNLEKLKAIHDAIENDGKFLEFLVPIGEWDYGKACDAWGTKWDITEGSAELEGDTLDLTFDTAWGPPTAAYETYTDANPDMHIEASYYEPGMAFVGQYDSGLGTDDYWEIDFSDDNWGAEIPQEVVDHWGLDYEYEQWKEWNDE